MIISSKVQTLKLNINSYTAGDDNVTTIDVSECLSLKSLNVKRSKKLTKLILKKGQMLETLIKDDFTEIIYK